MTLRWKLFLSHLAVILIVVVVVDGFTLRGLSSRLLEDVRDRLGREAEAVAEFAGPLETAGAWADGLADRFGARLGVRVTIVASDGQVLGDSEVPAEGLADIENHLYRPEIQEAFRSGRGSSVRYSTTVRDDLIYVALRTGPSGRPFIVRVAMPLSRYHETRSRWRRGLAVASGAGGLVAMALAWWVSRRLSWRMARMADFASRVAAGESPSGASFGGRGDEVSVLGRSLDRMASQIAEKVEALTWERDRRDAILSSMAEGIAAWDEEGRLMLSNPAFARLLGVPPAMGKSSPAECLRDARLLELHGRAAREGSAVESEVAPAGTSGRRLHARFSSILREGRVTGTIGVFQDVTELKRLEEIRRDFVLNAAHELKTPLSSILGYAETLAQGAASDAALRDRFIERIHANARRLGRLVEDLLTLGRIESGQWPIERKEVRLDEMLARLLLSLQPEAEGRHVRLVSGLGAGAVVRADEFALEQILFNLLDNAIKYNREGGQVTVRARATGSGMEIEVEDTGIGIPPADVDRVFERFYRVDKARSREAGGTGLGLAIVKHLAQVQGGRVSVVSVPGKGSTFRVEIPSM